MAFLVRVDGATVEVELRGWDRLMTWRRRFGCDASTIVGVRAADRASLESAIDHRRSGTGTHDGAKRPGRRRVGTMLGRDVRGRQFWAVAAGPGTARLLVLDLADHGFARAVLGVDDPDALVATIAGALGHD